MTGAWASSMETTKPIVIAWTPASYPYPSKAGGAMIHISAGTSAHAYPLSMHTAARRGRPFMRTVPRATSCHAVSAIRSARLRPISGYPTVGE